MNDTLKVIVQLLESGRPELQVAAAQVLGELHAKEPGALRALAGAVRRSPVLGRFAIDALAKIGTVEAWSTIARCLLDNEALADHAAHLLAEAGAATHGVLASLYGSAAVEQRPRLLAILAKAPSKEAAGVFVQALLTPELTDHAARLLLAALPALDGAAGKALAVALGKYLEGPLPESCLANAIQVLARLDAQGGKALLWRYAGEDQPATVRSAAFRAMRGHKLTAAQMKQLLDLLENPAQKDVHDAVRELLSDLPELPEGMAAVCKRLLTARQPEQRLFALRMLRTTGGEEMAKIALKLLDHEDERFRQLAAEALSHNKSAIEPLLKLVAGSRDHALAQTAVGVLIKLGAHLAPKALRAIAERAVKLLPTHTRAGDLLLDVVFAVGGSKLVPDLVESAIRLRRSKRIREALHLLARIASRPDAEVEVQYQLALTKLLADMVQGQQGQEAAAPGNATMGFFATLLRHGFPLATRLRKESVVTPEALLRVATHFTSAVGPERRFAAEILQHLATKTKGRTGEEARVALRTVGA